MDELLASWMSGGPDLDEQYSNQWMERGIDLEAQARSAYEFVTDDKVRLCGFVTRDDGMVGASPDGLIGEREVLELKCPKSTTHAHYMRTRKLEDDYYPQLQGELYVCERDIVHIQSYCPPYPPVIIRVGRDEPYIAKLKDALDAFVETMLEARERMFREYEPFISRIRNQQSTKDLKPPTDDAQWEAFCRPVV